MSTIITPVAAVDAIQRVPVHCWIGAFNNDGAERLAGVVARCIVRSGFAGTVVADFDSSLAGPTGYTDAYGNAWAIN